MTRKLKKSYNKTNWIMKSVWHEMVNIHVIQQLAYTLLLLDSKQGNVIQKSENLKILFCRSVCDIDFVDMHLGKPDLYCIREKTR